MSHNPFVLIVETDSSHGRELRGTLSASGFDCEETSDPVRGVQLLLAHEPSIFILSCDLPELYDDEFLLLVGKLTRAPIIAIGTGGDSEAVDLLLKGADTYLRKPVNNLELVSRVRRLLQRSASPAQREDCGSASFFSSESERVVEAWQ